MSCGAAVKLPATLLTAGPKRQGVAYLSRCLRCESDLSGMEAIRIPLPEEIGAGTSDMSFRQAGFKYWRANLVTNGRAILAALYFGRISEENDWGGHTLRWLAHLDQSGHLPHEDNQYGREKVKKRLATDLSKPSLGSDAVNGFNRTGPESRGDKGAGGSVNLDLRG